MAELRLYAFGAPRLQRGAQPIDLGLRKALALIVYLAVTQQAHSRDHLATLLWPDSDQRDGRARLRRTLHRMGDALGTDVVEAEGDTLRIRPGLELWLDCAVFRAEVTAGLPASPTHALATPRIAHLTRAVELYTAEFLQGFTLPDSPAFDEWQFFQRESLHQLYGQALEQLVQAHQHGGATGAAIPYARRWVALDPLHEPAQRTLMRLYAWSGQQGAALRQYQECARILEEELGAAPEAETTALYEDIRARRLAVPASRAPASAAQEGDRDGAHDEAAHPPAAQPAADQQVGRLLTEDRVSLAYATVGQGPPLVKAANWLSHLQFDWESPVWRHWLTALSADHTLVRYDERGCGLSQWDVGEQSFEAWVHDLETVVNHLGLRRFPLLGLSQGGAVAIAYAARHPERVSRIVLVGAYARGRYRRGHAPRQEEVGRTNLRMMLLGWGQDNPAYRQFFTSLFMPDATLEHMRWFNDLQRASATPEGAARIVETCYHIDVTHLARQVAVPTLVLHAREDGVVPVEEAHILASLIPGARLVELDGRNHIIREDEPAWPRFLAEVRQFLAEEAGLGMGASGETDGLAERPAAR